MNYCVTDLIFKASNHSIGTNSSNTDVKKLTFLLEICIKHNACEMLLEENLFPTLYRDKN